MRRRPPPGSTLPTDVALTSVAFVGLALTLHLAWAEPVPPQTEADAPVARIGRLVGEARRRASNTLLWSPLEAGSGIFHRDSLFVPADSDLLLEFTDGSTVQVEERSLVVIDHAPSGGGLGTTTLELRRGGLQGRAAEDGGLSVAAGGSDTTLEGGAVAAVRSIDGESARVEVFEGAARVRDGEGSVALGAKQAVEVGIGGRVTRSERLDIEVTAPGHGDRVFLAPNGSTLRFVWTDPTSGGPWVVERARDVAFRRELSRESAETPELGVVLADPGVHYWRVRRSDGTAASTTARLVAVVDRPPLRLRPAPGAVVYAPDGDSVTFVWVEAPSADAYRLSVSRDAAGRDPVLDETVRRARHRWFHSLPEGVYYWRVAVAAEGRATPGRATPFRLITKPIPAAPQLMDPQLILDPAAPAGEPPPPQPAEHGSFWHRLLVPYAWAQEAPVPVQVLRWVAVPGIETYDVEVAEDAGFTRVVLRERVAEPYLRWTPPSIRRDYWFRVRSIDPEGRPGVFSAGRQITRSQAGPAPLSPAEDARQVWQAAGLQLELTWAARPGDTTFEVEVAPTRDFAAPSLRQKVRDPKLTWSAPGPGAWHWRVRAFDAAGRASSFGAARRVWVVPPPPEPSSPADGSRRALTAPPAPLPLSWTEVPGAGSYEVRHRVAGAGPGSGTVTSSNRTRGRIRPDSVGTWEWEVRAVMPGKVHTDWSSPSRIVLERRELELVGPADGEVLPASAGSVSTELTWKAVDGAARYQVRLRRVRARTTLSETDDPTFTTPPLSVGGWTWSVAALDRGGRTVARSGWRKLEVAAGPGPRPLSPEDGARVAVDDRESPFTVRLEWEASTDAVGYELETRTSDDGEPTRLAVERAVHALPVDAYGPISWRVRARLEGTVSPWSPWRQLAAVATARRAVLEVTRPEGETPGRIRLQLLDAADQPAVGAVFSVEPRGARLGELAEESPAVHTASLVPDGSAQTLGLVVRAKDEVLARYEPVPKVAGGNRLALGVWTGLHTTFGGVVGPSAGGELAWRPGSGPWGLAVRVRLGYRFNRRPPLLAGDDAPGPATLHALQGLLLPGVEMRLARVTIGAGAGLAMEGSWARVPLPASAALASRALLAGPTLGVFAEVPLAPGALVLMLPATFFPAVGDRIRLGGPRLGLTLGLVIPLGRDRSAP